MSTTQIIPGCYDPRIARVFRIIARSMIRRGFHALRLTPGSLDRLDTAARHDGPVVCCMTHAGWWDPMFGLLLHIEHFAPQGRDGIAPIDKAVLNNLGIFKRLGLFGIDPDDPASMRSLISYALGRMAQADRPTLWITPQGRFQDPRSPIELRPGVSAILARLDRPQAMVLAMEYPFWDDKKPEMLGHIADIHPPARPGSTAAWHRVVTAAMRAAAAELAAAAMARDPAAFQTLLGGGAGGTFPVYDWILRLTGRSTAAIRTRAPASRDNQLRRTEPRP